MANQRAENKVNAMFWLDHERKQRFTKSCDAFGISMTEAFDRFIDGVVTAQSTGVTYAIVNLEPKKEPGSY